DRSLQNGDGAYDYSDVHGQNLGGYSYNPIQELSGSLSPKAVYDTDDQMRCESILKESKV
ncbi:hypothetical protein GE21DRAFT_1214245, partial [Neurospora crassa]